MQAATAIPGVHARAGDPASAPDGAAADGFSQALAALMALLWPGLAANAPTPDAGAKAGAGVQTPTPGVQVGVAAFAARPAGSPGPDAQASPASKQTTPIGALQTLGGAPALGLGVLPAAETTPGAAPTLSPSTAVSIATDPTAAAALTGGGANPNTAQTLAATPLARGALPPDSALVRLAAKGAGQTPPAIGAPTASAAVDVSNTAPVARAGEPLSAPQGLDAQAGSAQPVLSPTVNLAPLAPAAPAGSPAPTSDRGRSAKTDARTALAVAGAPKIEASTATIETHAAVSALAFEANGGANPSGPDLSGKPQTSADAGALPTPAAQNGAATSATLAGADVVPGAATPPPAAAAALAAANGAQITAQLAAQIGRKADARQGRFDFALEPQGLGRVDVSLKIDAAGQLSAMLSFDNPATAAEAKSRAADLQTALQQAGFDVSHSGLSFTSGGAAGGQGQAAWQDFMSSSPWSAAPVADAALNAAPVIPQPPSRPGGLDIRI